MSTIIQIKRNSGTTAPGTNDLVIGEMAYAYDASNDGVGGKLYIEAVNSSSAAIIHAIGGKYFTDLLDHTAGTTTASSALLVDANKKLNELLVDNITINGSDISSSDSNGNITLTPNGTGSVVINKNDGFRLPVGNTSQRLSSPTSGQIRYNSQIAAFEGYAASSWGTLGGVIDVDQDTKITAESAAGEDEDVLTFSAGGTAMASFDSNSADFASGTVVNVTNQLNVDNLRFDGNAITSTNSNGDVTISPNGTGNVSIGSDSLLIESAANETATVGIYAGEAAAALLVLSADDGDDNGDDWTLTSNVNNTLTIANDISGSVVNQIVLTPHATVASSITAIVGKLNVAGITTFAGAVNMGSQATTNVNIDSGAIDAVTIGTNSAVTDLRVDNLKLDANDISSTDSNGNVSITPNGSGNVVANTDALEVVGGEGETASLFLKADESDDASDDWSITAGTNGVLSFNNDIASAGTQVSMVTMTPHATVASSTLAALGNVTISGNLTVNGTTTTAASTNTVITDKLIELGNGATGSASGDVGHVFERGSEANVFVGWDESINTFVVGTGSFTGATTGDLSHTLAAAKFGSLTLTTDLAVADGGTGVSSFSNNGVLYGDGSSALDVTATPGGADATTSFQILSASSSNGVPVWTTSIDGGTY